jgi:hypothetical protein
MTRQPDSAETELLERLRALAALDPLAALLIHEGTIDECAAAWWAAT